MSLGSSSNVDFRNETGSSLYWYRAAARLGRVVFALMIREMKIRYGRSRFGYAMAFVSPTIQKGLLISLMMVAERKSPIGPSIVLFYWTGLTAYHTFSFVANRNMNSLKEAKKVRVLPVVRPMDLILARTILEIMTDLIIAGIGFILIYFYDTPMALPNEPLLVLEALGLLFILGFGVGLINATITVFVPTYQYLWGAVSIILMLISGIYRMPTTLPPQIRDYLAYNPISHGLELFRMGFYPSYPSYFLDVGYLTQWAAGSLFIGLLLERVMRRRLAAHR